MMTTNNSSTQIETSQQTGVNATEANQFAIKGIISNQLPAGKTQLDVLLDSITALPLWIRQLIYTDLRDALSKEMSPKTMKTLDKENFLQLWEPILTTRGKNELLSPSSEVSSDIRQLLKASKIGLNVANICTEYVWTLEKCCILICSAIANGYLEPSSSVVIDATARYLGNKIRLGEYLVETGRITEEEMQQALMTQQYITLAMGEHTNVGEILTRLELLDQEDVEAILFLKEESSKTFSQLR